jgi:hypothetical protein
MEYKQAPVVYYTFKTGTFFSFKKRYMTDIWGNIIGRSDKILNPRDITFDIQLTDDDGIKRNLVLARIVLSSFYGDPGPMMHADHINEEKCNDNSLENLQWLTPQENTKKQRPDIRDPISGIPVLRIDENNDEIPFVSANYAEILTGVSRGHIVRSCKTGGKAGGFNWIYDMSKIDQTLLDKEVWKSILKRDGTNYDPSSNIEVSDNNRIRFMIPIMRIFDVPDLITERGVEKKIRPSLTIQNERRCIAELICTTFNGPMPADCKLVRHIDDSYMNCTPDNLRWGTYQDNYQDALKNGKTSGINVIIDDEKFTSAKDAAEYLDISFGLLCGIIRKENKTIFSQKDFMKKIYIVNDKKFCSYVNASLEYCGKHTKSMKLVEEGKITIDYITVKEYNQLLK